MLRSRGFLASFALLAFIATAGGPLVASFGKNRTISLYNIHTKETVSVQYMVAGKHVPAALEKVNWVLRDWRRDEATKMDPELVDLLWEMHAELGSKEPIHIISGYRSKNTNEMLRKTVGGQASESRHILGKAADVQFPDVPLKRLRYSALVRERGGVGYYPTSATPFVHVDTDRVRHWPRLPRYELALLFPNGASKHVPADGSPIGRDDVQTARSQHRDLATQVAQFFGERDQNRQSILVADAGGKAPANPAVAARTAAEPRVAALVPPSAAPAPLPAAVAGPKPAPQPARVASLGPPMGPTPELVAQPKLVERSSRFTRPSDQDRSKLNELVTLAAYEPAPKLVAAPAPVARPAKPEPAKTQALASLSGGPALPLPSFLSPKKAEQLPRVAAIDPAAAAPAPPASMTDAGPGWGNGWVAAPAWDEEHPEELSYRPFPLAPLLTESASADDPVLNKLEHPDVARTADMIDQESAILPMAFIPGQKAGAMLWAQQFSGAAVNPMPSAGVIQPGLALGRRTVKTTSR